MRRITPQQHEPDLVPVVEIPNPEHTRWQQQDHDEGAEAPPEWLTLSVDRNAVDGSTMLRFMRDMRDPKRSTFAAYDLLELAFGADQMELLIAARLSPADLAGLAEEVFGQITG